MLALLRTRLTYANVVATLALFIALGGSAYAVTQISTKQVKNRSLRGVDLRKNTVTGKEIRESRLGPVRRALTASTATSADVAKNADAARTAGTADIAKNAESAGVAANAQALGGQGVGDFEKSKRTQFTRAVMSPAGASGERVLIDWPEMHARVETVTGNNGCSSRVGLRIRNTNSDLGGPALHIFEAGSRGSLGPAASISICSTPDGDFDGEIGNSSGRTLYFKCVGPMDGEVRCLTTRSEP